MGYTKIYLQQYEKLKKVLLTYAWGFNHLRSLSPFQGITMAASHSASMNQSNIHAAITVM